MALTSRKGKIGIKTKIKGHSIYIRIEDPKMPGIASTVHLPTEEEVLLAMSQYRDGKCEHILRYSQDAWPYDAEYCALCNSFLEMI